jgi:hypothetical protein
VLFLNCLECSPKNFACWHPSNITFSRSLSYTI